MTTFLDEAQVEIDLLNLLKGELSWEVAFGPDLAPDGICPARTTYHDVVLAGRLNTALARINPDLSASALDEAARQVLRLGLPGLVENNRLFHRMLTEGVDVECAGPDGEAAYEQVKLADFNDPANNDWLAVNQFTVTEPGAQGHTRRPDVVLFLNGLPVGIIELKNPADEQATVKKAYDQLQTYKQQVPSLVAYNALLVISDGLDARAGTITAGFDRFAPWRTVDGVALAPSHHPQAETLARGMFDPSRLLDLIRFFIVFEDDGQTISKKLAAYHQYFAVNRAVGATLRASGLADAAQAGDFALPKAAEFSPTYGDKRIGVVWHTQGSGKSLSMVYYSGKIIQHPAMENPTLVIITDRNDLDEQLHGTFAACSLLLRQTPERADSRAHLRQLLTRASGGVIFTTVHKFAPDEEEERFPELSTRRNIVVIADEAHRSQYDFIDGFAKHLRDALPHASFIGFTGTPIESGDRSTPAVFGNYIDVYDIQQAVEDGATVRIYYEGRLAKIELDESERPRIDPNFEDLTENEEEAVRQRLKSRWARLEAMVGTDKRIGLVAEDLVKHFEERQSAMEGKAMVVCMSRRICVELYKAIVKLRPEWHDGDDLKGVLKVVMTGSASDPLEWQDHARNKARREELAKRFKNPADPLRIVIVRDMWLTGFDCPCLHTMYVDKPMQGHGLMQAIARVNRVFRDKPGGLVVDYLGLADQLKKALADYTQSGGRGKATFNQAEAVAVMLEKYEVVCGILHGFDWRAILEGPREKRMAGLAATVDFVFGLKDGKRRMVQAVTELSKAFALSVPNEEALRIRDDVGFFQAVKAGLTKTITDGAKTQDELDAAVRQIVSRSVIADGVVDIFAAAGLDKPDISILSDEFLQEVRDLPYRNLAVEVLERLLNDQIKTRARRNLVQSRTFSEMLEESIRKYQNRAIEAAQVIEELIQLAKDMRAAQQRGEELGLNEDEVAFYDALEVNDSAVAVLGDDCLRKIARELVEAVRGNTSIDWTAKESVRAKLRTLVKRILRKYGYPPDKEEAATRTVLAQAEVLTEFWMPA